MNSNHWKRSPLQNYLMAKKFKNSNINTRLFDSDELQNEYIIIEPEIPEDNLILLEPEILHENIQLLEPETIEIVNSNFYSNPESTPLIHFDNSCENFSHLTGELVDIGDFLKSGQKVEIVQFNENKNQPLSQRKSRNKKYRMRYFSQELF